MPSCRLTRSRFVPVFVMLMLGIALLMHSAPAQAQSCDFPFYFKRGDINVNAIANEVADALLFEQYLIHGIEVFNADPGLQQQQICATDCNSDQTPLTFRDLVYLWRVVYGDAIPFPKPAGTSATATFTQSESERIVVADFPGHFAGVFLIFDGNITPYKLWPASFRMVFDHVDGQTRVLLLLQDIDSTAVGSGQVVAYSGFGRLVEGYAGDWFDSEIPVSIVINEIQCGDFDGSGYFNITDAVAMVRYVFGGIDPGYDPGIGDVNCDNIVSISDIVYMISHIFAGGPAPCANCP